MEIRNSDPFIIKSKNFSVTVEAPDKLNKKRDAVVDSDTFQKNADKLLKNPAMRRIMKELADA